jgi:hypothetical protein
MFRKIIFLIAAVLMVSAVSFSQAPIRNANNPVFIQMVADSVIVKDTTQGLKFGTGATGKYLDLAGAQDGYVLKYNAATKTMRPAVSPSGTSRWDLIETPLAPLSLIHAYPTSFKFFQGALYANNDFLSLSDTFVTPVGLGNLFSLRTIAGSNMKPLKITAQGTTNGVEVGTDGVLKSIGSGAVQADNVRGNYPLAKADIHAQVAYKDASNTFVATQTIQTGTGDGLITNTTSLSGIGLSASATTGRGASITATSGTALLLNSATGVVLNAQSGGSQRFLITSNLTSSLQEFRQISSPIRMYSSGTFPKIIWQDLFTPNDTSWLARVAGGGVQISNFANLTSFSGTASTGSVFRTNDDFFVQTSEGKQRAYTEANFRGIYYMRNDSLLISFPGAATTDRVVAMWDASRPGVGNLIVESRLNEYLVYPEQPGQADSSAFNIEIKDKVW